MTDDDQPWNWIQPYDLDRMGSVIQDASEQKRWCDAVILAGALPYMWRRMAAPLMQLMYDKLGAQVGDRVLIVGEGIEACGFERDIRSRVGPAGSISSFDIMETARTLSAAGRKPQWSWDYTSGFPDASFDCVAVLQAVAHSDDWRATAKELTRVLKAGGKILLAEITFPPTIKFASELDIHLEYWLTKIFSGARRSLDNLTYCSLDEIQDAFRDLLIDSGALTWRGIDLFWGARPLGSP